MIPKNKKIIFLILAVSAAVLLPACQPAKRNINIFSFDKQRYKLPKYDSLDYFNISPDGGRFLAIYMIKGKWYAQVNKMIYDDFQGAFRDSFSDKPRYSLSPEGSKVGLVYQKERLFFFKTVDDDTGSPKLSPADTLPMWFVQVNQHLYGGFDGDYMPEIKYSPDGSMFGFVYKENGLYYIRLNDQIFGPYQKADLTITAEGKITIARLEKGYAYLEEIEIIPNPKSK